MTTKLDARQMVSRDVLDQMAVAAGVELDNLLRSLNSNDTSPLKMSATGTDRVVSIGSIFVTNPETSKNRTIPTISNTLPSFTSGTITADATGAGNLVYSPSIASPTAIGMVASQFRKFSINLDAAGNLTIIGGTAGASLAAATAPPSINNTFGIGYFVLRTDASNNIANILTSDLYQYVGGGGGGGGAGDTTDIVETLKNQLNNSTWNLVTPNIFSLDEDTKVDGVSTGAFNLVSSTFDIDSAQTMVSTQMLDPDEFLTQGKNVGKISLSAFWKQDAIDDAAVYEVSRNGGDDWQTVDMERVGIATETFVGSHEFQDIETGASISSQSSRELNTDILPTAADRTAMSQLFTVPANSYVKSANLTLKALDNGISTTVFANSAFAGEKTEAVANGDKTIAVALNGTVGRMQRTTDYGRTWQSFTNATWSFPSNTPIMATVGNAVYYTDYGNGQRLNDVTNLSSTVDSVAAPFTAPQRAASDNVNIVLFKNDSSDFSQYNYSANIGSSFTAHTIASFSGSKIFAAHATSTGRWIFASESGLMSYTSTLGSGHSAVANTQFGGDTIFDIASSPTRVLAVGQSGKMSYSDDDGVTWTAITPVNGVTIQRVNYNVEKDYFITIGLGFRRVSKDGINWVSMDASISSIDISLCSMNNGATVFTGIDGVIYRYHYIKPMLGQAILSIHEDLAGVPGAEIKSIPIDFSSYDFKTTTTDVDLLLSQADDYHLVVGSSSIYKNALPGPSTLYSKFAVFRTASGSGFSEEINSVWGNNTGSLTHNIFSYELDLRVRITASQNDVALDGYGIFYDNDPVTVVGNTLQLQVFKFKAVADNLDTFTLTNFLPNADLLKVYYVEGGQVFHYGAFSLQGHDVIFPEDTFNNNAVEADITLVFDQMRGGAYNNSDTDAALLAANHLGSSDATIDKSITGRGILIRNAAGLLRELSLDSNDDIVISTVP